MSKSYGLEPQMLHDLITILVIKRRLVLAQIHIKPDFISSGVRGECLIRSRFDDQHKQLRLHHQNSQLSAQCQTIWHQKIHPKLFKN